MGKRINGLVCPRCNGVMTAFEHQGVEIDFCQSCGATWFDEGEVAQYFMTRTDLPDNTVLLATYDEKGPRCPQDSSLLQQYKYVEWDSLVVDVCPACKGVLLDRGEVAKLEKIAGKIGQKVMKAFELFEFED